MGNEIAVIDNPQNGNLSKPFQDFSVDNMNSFYGVKQFLHYIDATSLVEACILEVKEIKTFQGCYDRVYDPVYIEGFLAVQRINHLYKARYNTKEKIYISTSMLMEKLDAALYYWRELNPELVQLLSENSSVELPVIVNWVKMILYMAPTSLGSTF